MKSNKTKKQNMNAWKKYGVLFMTGLLSFGVIAGNTAFAEESAEEEQRITLRVADADETEVTEEEETEAQTETEQETEKETFEPIESVDSSVGQIIATDVSGIIENFMPAMVSITNKSTQAVDTMFYGVQEYESEGAASGIIIAQDDDELLIATNSHVVDDATDTKVWFTVEAEDPETLGVPGKIKGMDKNYELAVVAVKLADIPKEVLAQIRVATLGTSADLKVGQTAIAVGNELGYGQSVTCGVISALNRKIDLDRLEVPLILMDTPINFGSSGGAVLNSKGQVIGISVAKETGDGSESMGYAIPIDEAIPILENLANKETRDKMKDSERGYIGASVVNVNDDAKELYDMPEGAFVYSVNEDSAAEKAGIKKGDIITKFDGATVYSSDDLIDKISYYKAGETVVVELQTANNGTYESREVEVTLQEGNVEETEESEETTPETSEDKNESNDGVQNYDDEFPVPDFFEGFEGFPFNFNQGNRY